MSDISDKQLLESLKKYFKHSNFKSDEQKNAIKNILKKKGDTYVSMPTGSGKSLCFHLPGAMQENQITIVFEPLLSLMKNQLDFLRSLKIPAETINSDTRTSDRSRIIGDLKAKKTTTKFLYITPEQAVTSFFEELMESLVKFNKVAFIAVDEAHCVSQWGHDFRKAYMKLGRLRLKYPGIPWIALTATAPLKVKEDLMKNLALSGPAKCFQTSCFRPNLYYDVAFKNLLNEDFIELKQYVDRCLKTSETHLDPSEKPCGIIYCRKKDTTESVAKSLRKLGMAAAAFHSGMKDREKEQVQNDWMNGKLPVIVATVSFGMGIDKGPVRFVIHWDLPQSISAWYQESGRAGRDNKHSFCRVYYDREEVRSISFLLQQDIRNHKDKNAEQLLVAEKTFKEFQKISDHCEGVTCRHRFFTNYFGDPTPNCSKMCDACKNKVESEKNLEKFQQISVQAKLGGFNAMPDQDPVSLYGGGRDGCSNQESFESYNNTDESYSGFRKASDTRSIIDKQFALRKAQAAEKMEMHSTAEISKVKAAQSTEIKVQGLTNKVRESNLKLLSDMLKSNMEKCEKADPQEVPVNHLVYKDFEDIGKVIEYNCFTSSTAISIYRMKIAKAFNNIKICTGLYPELKDHVPAKRRAYGGDAKTVINNLRERYGDDAVQELEDEKKKKTERVKKDKFQQSGRDGKNQTRINSFFSKAPNQSPDLESDEETKPVVVKEEISELVESSSSSSSDSNLAKLELIKIALKKELDETAVEEEPKVVEQDNTKINLTDDTDTENDQQLVIDESPIDKGDGYAVEPVKRKIEVPPSSVPSKRSRVDEYIPKESKPSNSTGVSRDVNKKHISMMVVKELDPFYKTKKIQSSNPKDLFKAVARKITHEFYEINPDKPPHRAEVKKFISELFFNKGIVKSINDIQ